jgi:hypothetical protein
LTASTAAVSVRAPRAEHFCALVMGACCSHFGKKRVQEQHHTHKIYGIYAAAGWPAGPSPMPACGGGACPPSPQQQQQEPHYAEQYPGTGGYYGPQYSAGGGDCQETCCTAASPRRCTAPVVDQCRKKRAACMTGRLSFDVIALQTVVTSDLRALIALQARSIRPTEGLHLAGLPADAARPGHWLWAAAAAWCSAVDAMRTQELPAQRKAHHPVLATCLLNPIAPDAYCRCVCFICSAWQSTLDGR